MSEVLIGVEITAQEADVFRKMRETGCFELRDANCTLHFSKTGKLLRVEKKLYTSFDFESKAMHDTLVK
jgi:hypothetical protein